MNLDQLLTEIKVKLMVAPNIELSTECDMFGEPQVVVYPSKEEADLIASAPEYLRKLLAVVRIQREALEKISNCCGERPWRHVVNVRNDAREALAKCDQLAKGESK